MKIRFFKTFEPRNSLIQKFAEPQFVINQFVIKKNECNDVADDVKKDVDVVMTAGLREVVKNAWRLYHV